jgi:hypothetical protein
MFKVTVRFKSWEEEDFLCEGYSPGLYEGPKFVTGLRLFSFYPCYPDRHHRVYNLDSVESFLMEKIPDEKVKE